MPTKKKPSLANNDFKKLCMEGDLARIQEYVEYNKGSIDLDLNMNHSKNMYVIYFLAKNQKLDVLKFLFENPDIIGIPDVHQWVLEGSVPTTAFQLLYQHEEKEFLKYLLTSKDIKDNIKTSWDYVEHDMYGNAITGYQSYILVNAIKNDDWEFADYLLNCPDIKYPITKTFSIITATLNKFSDLPEKDFDELTDKLLNISHSFFGDDKRFDAIVNLSKYGVYNALSESLSIKVLHKLMDKNLIDYKYLLHEIEERRKDKKWLKEFGTLADFSKYLLHKVLSEETPEKGAEIKKPKI